MARLGTTFCTCETRKNSTFAANLGDDAINLRNSTSYVQIIQLISRLRQRSRYMAGIEASARADSSRYQVGIGANIVMPSPPVIVCVLISPKASVVLLETRVRDGPDLFGCKLETRKLGDILLESLLFGACRDRHNALVKRPSQRHVPLGHIVFLGESGVHVVHRTRRRTRDGRQSC